MAAEIRLARSVDTQTLARMRYDWTVEDGMGPVRERGDFERAFVETVARGLADGRWRIWVADEDGAIVSHVFVGLIEKVPRPTRDARWIGYVTNVYTRPEHRGRGVGTLVLEAVQAWAADEGVELLFVWPSDESVSFYESAGFSSGRDPLVWEPE